MKLTVVDQLVLSFEKRVDHVGRGRRREARGEEKLEGVATRNAKKTGRNYTPYSPAFGSGNFKFHLFQSELDDLVLLGVR